MDRELIKRWCLECRQFDSICGFCMACHPSEHPWNSLPTIYSVKRDDFVPPDVCPWILEITVGLEK